MIEYVYTCNVCVTGVYNIMCVYIQHSLSSAQSKKTLYKFGVICDGQMVKTFAKNAVKTNKRSRRFAFVHHFSMYRQIQSSFC